jgi:hypothetical protein
MNRPSRLSLVLPTTLAIAGLVVLVLAEVIPIPRGPNVSPMSGQVIVHSPGIIQGVASSVNPGLIVVHASIDGVELPDSPDDLMEEDVNEYSFVIPEGQAGKILVIQAIDDNGMITEVRHVIHP